LRLFFGQSYFESEVNRREYFAGQDFPPTIGKKVLEDKTVIPFWYKLPDQLMKHQLKSMVTAEQLEGLQRVDFTIGGDRGGSKFWMALKCLLRFSDRPTISKVFQIASVSHSKDDISILQSMVIDPIGTGARLIVEGGHFSVEKDTNGTLDLSFLPRTGNKIICNVTNRVLVVGDLAQMLGHENMSRSWCMWCRSHPSEWSSLDKCFSAWTIEELKTHKDRIVAERLKEPRDICGVVSYPVWDFIEPLHYIFLELHVEIGLVNNVLDKFYDWVEDHIEVASAEEKLCRNKMIILDTELTKAANKLERWKTLHGTELTESRNRLSDVQTALRSRRTGPQERQLLDQQQQQLNATISLLADAKK
jgi:hypothetical protein